MIEPVIAAVRPRVTSPVTGDSVLLQEEVLDLLEQGIHQPIVLVGRRSSGKTTALRHLAAVLPNARDLHWIDDAKSDIPPSSPDNYPVICTRRRSPGWGRSTELRLLPWGEDELIEYLLAVHPDHCREVISRTADGRSLNGSPHWWPIVLDILASDNTVPDVQTAICMHLNAILPINKFRDRAERYCLLACEESLEPDHVDHAYDVLKELRQAGLSKTHEAQLAHPAIRRRLAAEYLVEMLKSSDPRPALAVRLPRDLLVDAGVALADDPKILKLLWRQLREFHLTWSNNDRCMGTLISLLRFADPDWRPKSLPTGIDLGGAYLDNVDWPQVCLRESDLTKADFSGAVLTGADLRKSYLNFANFSSACLESARLTKAGGRNTDFSRARLRNAIFSRSKFVEANFTDAVLESTTFDHASCIRANFSGACLREAQMSETDLSQCQFDEADLTAAKLNGVQLSGVDLRTPILDQTDFTKAWMAEVNLENVDWTDATLPGVYMPGSYLTGSRLQRANLQNADLRRAMLGEIDWEGADLRGADLRGAVFHMGSSREGLLSSPYASEGTRTGFYTDEFTEQHFKPPEEIRKASLRGCDLRGANIEGLDFYLVDLRDACLTPDQLAYVEQCGAILTTED